MLAANCTLPSLACASKKPCPPNPHPAPSALGFYLQVLHHSILCANPRLGRPSLHIGGAAFALPSTSLAAASPVLLPAMPGAVHPAQLSPHIVNSSGERRCRHAPSSYPRMAQSSCC